MPTSRPFAYNTSGTIEGTTQVGNLAVGFPTSGFTNSPQFWNGPDEDLGYVIAQPVSGNTQPTPIDGVFASVGFFRSSDLTDSSFIELTNTVFNQSFTEASDASVWLTTNGYWNSYPCLGIATNAGGGLTGFNVGGQAIAFQITSNPAIGTTYPIGSLITFQNGETRTFVGYDDYGSVYDMFYDSPISSAILFPITICTQPPTPTPTPTTTPTNTQTPTTTNTQTPTPTNTTTQTRTPTQTPTQTRTPTTQTPTPTPTVTPSPTPFTPLAGSLLFNGSNQTLGLSPGVTFGAGAFTLEGWFYNNSNFNSKGIIGSPVTSPTGCMNLYFGNNTTIISDKNGGGGSFSYTMGSAITTNAWHYLIYNRNAGGLTAVYIDGVRCTATSTDTLNYNTATDTVSRYYGGYWPGYWTNMRMTIGTAVYDSSLTTQVNPRGPLTSLGNTKYLMLGAAVTTDTSGIQTVTNNNTVTQTSLVKPF